MRNGTDTRERIERAALTLFATKGVAATSIRDIAKAAGVSLGAMYNHYPSKDDLGWLLFSNNFSAIGLELRRRARQQPELEAKLRAMVGYVFELFDEDWAMVTYVFSSRHNYLQRVSRRMGNPYLAFRAVIVEAMGKGDIPRSDTELMASMVTGAIIQTIDTAILGVIKGSLVPRAEPVAKSCLGLLRV